MTTIAQIRQQYPQYNDLSDKQLADRLYEQHYSDMPRAEFDLRVGYRPRSWGEAAGGLARQVAQGFTFNTADEIEAGLRALAGADYGSTVEDIRRQNRDFAADNPVTSVAANIAGGVVPFVAGPGAGLARLAVGSTLPRTMLRSGALGAGTGAVAGFGAGEGDVGERLPGALAGAGFGAGLGLALPPIIAGAGRALNAVSPFLQRAARRPPPGEEPLSFNAYSHPIEGATFTADGAPPPTPPPGQILPAQERVYRDVETALLRTGRTPQQLEELLAEASASAKPHSSGQAQVRTALVDLDEGLSRLAGVYARQSPEAAREMTQVMQARQTGITPMGADPRALGQRGIPSRPRLAPPMTSEQAQRELGSTFGAGSGNLVPMGARASIRDWLERFFLIKDKKHHGFGRTGVETMEQAAARADEVSRANYDAARRAHAMSNFRTQVDDVFNAALTRAATTEAPTVEKVIRDAHALFRPGRPINLEQFDNTKRVLDNRIRALLSEPDTVHAGGILSDVQQRLLAAVDDATGGARSLYAKARGEHAAAMENMRAYLGGRHALTEDQALRRTGPLADLVADENAAIRYFRQLGEDATPTGNGKETLGQLRQKLWRQGFVDAMTAKLPRDVNRSGLRLFNEDRVQRLMRETAPAETVNRAELLGRYIDFEGRMPETKHVSTGNSLTAMRVQDDLMAVALEASQNVQSIMELFRGNTSLYQLGERLFTRIYDRFLGPSADAAREGARILFTGNRAEQLEFLRGLAARMPASRMALFTQRLQEMQQYLTASASMLGGGATGGAAAPTPVASGGPVSF